MKTVLIVMLLFLASCVLFPEDCTERIALARASDGAHAHCGPYQCRHYDVLMVPGYLATLEARLRSCVEDFQRQGYEPLSARVTCSRLTGCHSETR
jgi:hypothetical protein